MDDVVADSNLYHLHAILVHSGSLNSGHYYCFIRPQLESDQWFKFNDQCVSEVNQRHAFNVGMGGYTSNFELRAMDEFQGANEPFGGSNKQLGFFNKEKDDEIQLSQFRKTENQFTLAEIVER